MTRRCEHHVPYESITPPVTYPLPRCPRDATVHVHGYLLAPMPCCDECAARIATGLAFVTTTPIT
jgi:hypothetical protein